MEKGLNEKQAKVLKILQLENMTGKSPSVRELCEKTGISSPSTVWRIVKSLEEAGLIRVEKNTARGITLTQQEGKLSVNLPLISDMDPITGKTDFKGEFLPYLIPHKYKDKCYAFTSKDNVAEIKTGDKAVFLLADIVPNGYLAAVKTLTGLRIGAVFHRNEGTCVLLGGIEYRIGSEADIAIVGRIIGFVRDFP